MNGDVHRRKAESESDPPSDPVLREKLSMIVDIIVEDMIRVERDLGVRPRDFPKFYEEHRRRNREGIAYLDRDGRVVPARSDSPQATPIRHKRRKKTEPPVGSQGTGDANGGST
jgi:hypothetical protein